MMRKFKYRNLTIKHKLWLIILVAVVPGAALACTGCVLYERATLRADMRAHQGTLAQMLATNSTAALSFGDRHAGEELLVGLRAKRELVAAHIYSADGRTFASYYRDPGTQRTAPPLDRDGIRFEDHRMILFRSIIFNNQKIGTIYLESDLRDLNARLQGFGVILFIISLGVSLVAPLLTYRLQRSVSKPVADLTETAKLISVHKDFSVRAVKVAEDDLGQLTDTFNGMLAEIQLRDEQLQRHRAGSKKRLP